MLGKNLKEVREGTWCVSEEATSPDTVNGGFAWHVQETAEKTIIAELRVCMI